MAVRNISTKKFGEMLKIYAMSYCSLQYCRLASVILDILTIFSSMKKPAQVFYKL
jgi:hypothetical protein